jgi:hypothetical protein
MTETTFRECDYYDEDSEHDDYMTAEDYDVREYNRNGWNESRYERQRF